MPTNVCFFLSLSLSFNVSLFSGRMCVVDFSAGARAVVSIILHLIRVYFPLHPVITCSIIRMENKQWLISLKHPYSKLNVSHNDSHTCSENIKKRIYFFEKEKKIGKFQVSQFIRKYTVLIVVSWNLTEFNSERFNYAVIFYIKMVIKNNSRKFERHISACQLENESIDFFFPENQFPYMKLIRTMWMTIFLQYFFFFYFACRTEYRSGNRDDIKHSSECNEIIAWKRSYIFRE